MLKLARLRNPIAFLLLSLSSVLLLGGLLFLRWPFEIPGTAVSRLWFLVVFEPAFRALSSGDVSLGGASSMSISWWPFALGIVLLLPVVGAIGRLDHPLRKWAFLIGLALCLSSLGVVKVFYATSYSILSFDNVPLILELGLRLGVGVSLAGIGFGVVEGGPVPLSRRLALTIRTLLVSAAVGIGSFVLLPLGSIAFALALAVIAFAYAKAALAPQ
jgi:hypothetical protein